MKVFLIKFNKAANTKVLAVRGMDFIGTIEIDKYL